jgi:glycolate oxidase
MEAGADLIERARLVCGTEHLFTDPVELSTYRSDGVRRRGPLPLAVVLPGDGAEVAGVVSACRDTGVAWVVRGAGTSREGHALPVAGALLIVLTRMRRVLSLDLADDELTVEPGLPTVTLARAVLPTHRLQLDHPGTVGGAAALGVIGRHLIGLQLVEADGALVSITPRSNGYDVPGAFGGSQGTAGIAVALTLRAVPAP